MMWKNPNGSTRGATWVVGGCIAAAMLSGVALAEEKVIETKKENRTVATSVDFAGALGLSFPSLTGLGARIEQARSAADPVGLAGAARELAAAEAASGKKASITSADLTKEAVDLARLRRFSKELKAVAALVTDAGTRTRLEGLATEAAAAEAQVRESKDSGEKTKGIRGRLHVDNRTGYFINVYIDSRKVGTVGPYGDGYVYVGQSAYETTYLYATAPGTSLYWRTKVSRPVANYTWVLSD